MRTAMRASNPPLSRHITATDIVSTTTTTTSGSRASHAAACFLQRRFRQGSVSGAAPTTANDRTDYCGGRGIDYDLRNEEANEKGGLKLIITHVPDSEREWVQWTGRTARQDKNGQYCHVLCRQGEPGEAGDKWSEFIGLAESKDLLQPGIVQDTELPARLLELRNEQIEEKLEKYGESLARGSRLTALCGAFYRNSPGGRISSRWPGNPDEIKLRDFLEGGSARHTEAGIAALAQELGISGFETATYSWEYMNDRTQWDRFSEEHQRQLSAGYFRKPVPERLFDLLDPGMASRYSIDLTKMEQTNRHTRVVRHIRCIKSMEGKFTVVPRLAPAAAGVQILSRTMADTATKRSLQRCLQTDSSQLGIGRDVVYARGWAHVANAAERQMKIACA